MVGNSRCIGQGIDDAGERFRVILLKLWHGEPAPAPDGAHEVHRAPCVSGLREAARLSPLPEYQWTLAEALRSAGEEADAATDVEVSGAYRKP